jgi:hypothetical protein
MHGYATQPLVTEKIYDSSGMAHTIVNPNRLENFKATLESHVSMLTTEVITISNHAKWIEPRLHEYLRFMQWMEQAHPDIITAYKASTEVAEKLDKANNTEHDGVQMESGG